MADPGKDSASKVHFISFPIALIDPKFMIAVIILTQQYYLSSADTKLLDFQSFLIIAKENNHLDAGFSRSLILNVGFRRSELWKLKGDGLREPKA